MAVRRPRALLNDETDAASIPTRLDFRVSRGKVETVPVTSNHRLGPTVSAFKLSDPSTRKQVVVASGVAQLGSAPSNDLVLEDATVSRCHCEVKIEDHRAMVRDLGSTNGTFIDGVRVREGYLRNRSTLKLGQATVLFQLIDRQHPIPISEHTRFGELLGQSDGMRIAFEVLEKASKSDSTVIVEGETGTGKTRAAQALHQASARSEGPFLVVDCGAMPAALLEAELFGHEKGAFTGAVSRRLGVFEEAQGGTVLLDEIGELPLELQPKLLRVLEDRLIRRVGQNKWTKVDVRILAATHRDLRVDVNSGRFRSDLYFRLAVLRVPMPALRQHPEDISIVGRSLLERLGATQATHPNLFSAEFFSSLAGYSWPGNVRELRNYLERCILFEQPQALGEAALPVQAVAVTGGALSEGRQRAIDAFERAYLSSLLERHEGKVSQAAVEAEVDRVYLYRLMRKHGIKSKA
jgi:two-component system response regulator GlrR